MFDPVPEPENDRDRQIRTLAENVKANLPKLKKLAKQCKATWGGEDHFYRFYHHSFKVYYANLLTKEIVEALRSCAPPAEDYVSPGGVVSQRCVMNKMFMEIVEDAINRKFTYAVNNNWLGETRQVIEAFLHAKFFLELVIKFSDMLLEGRRGGEPGYVAVLNLYTI